MTTKHNKKPHSRQSRAVLLDSQPTPPTPPNPTTETDPVFTASEAAKFVPGDKAVLDNLVATVTAQTALITGMQAQIASILAQLAALTPSLEAIGFGEPGACGKLTMIGMFAGKPMYQAAGGWWYCWNPDGGMWICRDALPGTGDLSNNRYADSGYAADITAVNWGPGFNPGMMPYGSIS